ncbi:hypothetical protein MTO96_038206 [Rhipicephalus appendiculatus]
MALPSRSGFLEDVGCGANLEQRLSWPRGATARTTVTENSGDGWQRTTLAARKVLRWPGFLAKRKQDEGSPVQTLRHVDKDAGKNEKGDNDDVEGDVAKVESVTECSGFVRQHYVARRGKASRKHLPTDAASIATESGLPNLPMCLTWV